MAQLGDTRKNMESAFMNEYWKVRKEIGQPEDRNEYWNEVLEILADIGDRYNRDDYIVNVLIACADDLEQRSSEVTGAKFYKGKDATLMFFNEIRKRKGLPPVGVIQT